MNVEKCGQITLVIWGQPTEEKFGGYDIAYIELWYHISNSDEEIISIRF